MNTAIPMSIPALRYAVEICELTPNYRVGVAVNGYSKIQSAMDGLTDYVDCCQLAKLGTTLDQYICFKNGSRIDVVSAAESALGHRWNVLIYGEDIDDKIFRCVLCHCNTRPYLVSD